jgi:hypothetical protein
MFHTGKKVSQTHEKSKEVGYLSKSPLGGRAG